LKLVLEKTTSFYNRKPRRAMAKQQSFYVTTPIYYPNDSPHLGHAYTTLAADIIARWHTLQEKKVFFLTGTDEHGKKLQEAAEKAGKSPQAFVDSIVPEFKEAWKKLNVHYDRFIRTTDKDHEAVVQKILAKVHAKGDIYKGTYTGLYCVGCEAYYTEKDLNENCCPIHKKPVEQLTEATYFFKLSAYEKKLLAHYKKHPAFIQPTHRAREIIKRVEEGLQDLSISRTSFKWGIPLPFDKQHVSYVWFDALLNYYSATTEKGKEHFWPAQVHLIGKDILWFHAVYWPAMLLSAGLPLPTTIFAHGWWTVQSEKMGKSAGNAIKVDQLIAYAGVDSARYFLFRNGVFGEDGDFSEHALKERHNNELANKLGNLVSRVSTLAETYGLTKTKGLETKKLIAQVTKEIESYQLDKALATIFTCIDSLNELIQKAKPWETKDTKVLYQLADGIKIVTILLSPFMPTTAATIAKTFHFELTKKQLTGPLPITKIKKAPILFQKIDMATKQTSGKEGKKGKEESKGTVKSPSTPNTHDTKGEKQEGKLSYDDFSKVELKVGLIKDAKPHPNADKLYVLTVDLGEDKPRTIVAGLRNHYAPEHLKGKKAIFVANLAPVTLRGVESNGMILAAVNDDDSHVVILTPEQDIPQGSKIR
jgi:methionyl-tRNA synthetase